MACCGPEIKKVFDKERLWKQLRDIDGQEEIKLKLKNGHKLRFSPKTGQWEDNIEISAAEKEQMMEEFDRTIELMKYKIKEKELLLSELEKKYLARVVLLLNKSQTHIEIKKDNEELFEKYGLKTGNHFL